MGKSAEFCVSDSGAECALTLIFPIVTWLSLIVVWRFSRKAQIEDADEIDVNYTFNHIIKLTMSMLCAGTSVALFFWNVICEDTVVGGPLIEDIGDSFIWVMASIMLRKEYLATGRTSLALRIWWAVMMVEEILIITLMSAYDGGMPYFDHVRIELVVALLLYTGLALIGYLRPSDMALDKKDVVEGYYKKVLDNYVKMQTPQEMREDIWGKLEDIKVIEEEEKKLSLEKNQSMREKIMTIDVDGYEIIDQGGEPAIYYNVTVRKGKVGKILEKTKRKYEEFAGLYKELQIRFPSLSFPVFPPLIPSQNRYREDILKTRQNAFDELMKFLVLKNIPLEAYKDFLLPNSALAFYGKEANSEVYSPAFQAPVVVSVEEVKEIKEIPEINETINPEPKTPKKKKKETSEISMEPITPPPIIEEKREFRSQSLILEPACRVNILSTYESGSGYSRHTMYEIGVKYGKEHIICAHRFKDFKKLHEELKKDFSTLPEMPSSGLTFSSTDPEIVSERRDKLEKFLAECVENPAIRNHQAVMDFLELNKASS